MNFGFFRKKSVNHMYDDRCGMPPAFSGRHPKLFLISDLNRVDTGFAEVQTDIARSFLKSIRPLLTLQVFLLFDFEQFSLA